MKLKQNTEYVMMNSEGDLETCTFIFTSHGHSFTRSESHTIVLFLADGSVYEGEYEPCDDLNELIKFNERVILSEL